jgi:poly(A) polymerase
VLAKLRLIILEWVKQCGRDDNRDEETIENSGGTLVTFGSYKLGVSGPKADIDTLCVVPKHITKDHFFEKLVPVLRETPGVVDLTAVR